MDRQVRKAKLCFPLLQSQNPLLRMLYFLPSCHGGYQQKKRLFLRVSFSSNNESEDKQHNSNGGGLGCFITQNIGVWQIIKNYVRSHHPSNKSALTTQTLSLYNLILYLLVLNSIQTIHVFSTWNNKTYNRMDKRRHHHRPSLRIGFSSHANPTRWCWWGVQQHVLVQYFVHKI